MKVLAEVKQFQSNVLPFPTRQSPRLRCVCTAPSSVQFTNVGWLCSRCLLPAKEGC